jgi:hypothetical protein
MRKAAEQIPSVSFWSSKRLAGGDDGTRTRDLMRDSSILVNGKKPQN